jgi:hypothetical protein
MATRKPAAVKAKPRRRSTPFTARPLRGEAAGSVHIATSSLDVEPNVVGDIECTGLADGVELAAKSKAAAPQGGVKDGRKKDMFTAEFYNQITNYCLLGATLRQLAEFLMVTELSVHTWATEDAKFAAAIKNGRENADAKVARSLYQRATGCSIKETHIAVIEGRVVQTQVTKNYPPDVNAAAMWLRNRAPDRWRDNAASGALTPEEIALEAQRVIAAAMATSTPSTTAPPPGVNAD